MKNYDSLINNQQSTINACLQENTKLKEDIEKLKEAKTQMEKVLDDLESTASKSNNKILSIPDLLGIIMKNTLFATISDVIAGTEYSTAKNQLSDGIRDVINKINELNNKIESNNSKISTCKSNITSLRSQKAADIKKEKEKNKEKA